MDAERPVLEVPSFDPDAIEAITFDFGNTLVPVHGAGLAEVVTRTAAYAAERWHDVDADAFRQAWAEERERQFLEDVPRMREADLDRRTIRVLARLRGAVAPASGSEWDDDGAGRYSERQEVEAVLRVYGDAFIDAVAAPVDVGPLVRRLADRRRLAVISNWPLAEIVERYLERAGWRDAFAAVVVSQAVGWIKPDRRIFEAAAAELGAGEPAALLHVGDDLGADVGGAKAVGWHAAWLRARPEDSPLPVADPRHAAVPDLVIDRLADLEPALERRDRAAAVGRP